MPNHHRICQSGELAEGQSKEVVVDNHVFALFRSEGQLYAIDGMCLHQGGPIARGTVAAGCVTCPWHGWQYDLNNGNNIATGKPMLSTYPLHERDGWIEIEI